MAALQPLAFYSNSFLHHSWFQKEKAAKKPKRFVLPKINFSWAKKIPQMTALPKAAARKAKKKAAKISSRVYKHAKQFYAKLSK